MEEPTCTLKPIPIQTAIPLALDGHLPDVEITCHICGRDVHSDYDPKRKGWLACPSCGPVWMPLGERWIRVQIAYSLEEASERTARALLALEAATTSLVLRR